LPLLEKATQLNPNDAGSHRFLGSLYDRRAQPNKALEHFSLAATLDPRDFLPQVWRCVSLTDLGEFRDASAACDKARELNPANLWGPLATAWVARAQGKPDEAIRWIDEALKLAPTDFNLADQKLDLLLTLGQFDAARTLVRQLPASEGFFNLAREAQIVLASEGADPLREWMARQKLADHAATGAELAELARLQFVANDPAAARATLAHANRILPNYAAADMFDGSQIRHEYAVALTHAGIELKGGGDAAKAQALLDDFDAMLDRFEQSGGTHYGLYSLRAISLAMQGKREQAEDALKVAWQRGWRSTWKAQREPYLVGLQVPGGK
jgi:tetratricopeptide (TPR) repeat protein